MATQSLTSKSKRTELDTVLSAWESRYKLRVLSKQLPRAIIVGLVISMVIGVIGYSQRLILAQNLAVITLAVTGISGLLTVLYTQLFPRPRDLSARYFDIEFGLKERMSTALELLDGRIQTHPEIESIQISDALVHAHEVDPNESITMDFRPVEWIAMAVLLLGMLAMILVPMLVGQDIPAQTPSPAVQAAREDVRDITESIATDTDLSELDREELLEALEIALDRLEEEDISDEEAFAAMSQLESQIEEVENELQDGINLDQSSLESASEALSDFTPPDETQAGEEVVSEEGVPQDGMQSAEDLSQALNELAQNAENLSEEEAQAAADALEQAAEDLAESNPELSQALQDMADALEAGDTEAAQQQAQNAQQELQQQQQQLQQDSNAQNSLSEMSEMTQQASQEIAQQQSQQQQPQQNSQPSQPQEGESESSQSQSGEGQQGDQPSDTTQQGDAQGNQQPAQNMPGASESESSQQNSETGGQGAGEGESNNTSLEGGGGEDQGADTDNNPTGEGVSDFESIYNPTGIDGGGNNELELESDASDETLREGEFEDNPLGESRVTYDTVFNDYQDAANRALESDYVPLGLRDVVRDYFTSLEPTGSE